MKCGLIGDRLSHSYSPQIHSLLADYEYKLYPLKEDEVKGFFDSKELDAFNVTIPYKKRALELCDSISERVRHIGAVNTVTKLDDGTYYGDNTDYDGFRYLVTHAGCDFYGKIISILGTGGATVMSACASYDMGAKKIYIVSRDYNKAEKLCGQLTRELIEENSDKSSASDIFVPMDYEMIKSGCDAKVLINATPRGMYPECEEPSVDLRDWIDLKYVFDIVANPYRSKLVLAAKEMGLTAEGGLRMLVAQAVEASGIFINKKNAGQLSPDDERIEKIYEVIAKEQCNIVLIGMPGCGKSTYGKKLAKELSKEFVDTDSLIEEKAGMTIPQIFEQFGEAKFREMEKDTLREVTLRQGIVIATGGGAILDRQNRLNLMMNGKVIFIDAPIEVLATTGRPLSKDEDALKKMYCERMPIYRSMADETIYRSK